MANKKKPIRRFPPGPGVDIQGSPVIDPTANVRELVEAANLRQDDLRRMESQHIRELLQRDREHARDINMRERDRIDAIRAVDVGAVQRAAEVQLAQATALATQTTTMAETLRGQVAAAATVQANALAAAQAANTQALTTIVAPLQKAIEELRQAQFLTAGGKAQVVEARDTRGERRFDLNSIISVIGLMVSVVLMIVLLTRG